MDVTFLHAAEATLTQLVSNRGGANEGPWSDGGQARSSFAIHVAFPVQHSSAGPWQAEHALALDNSQSHVPTRSPTLCSPSSPELGLKSDFHQDIVAGSMCCWSASTAKLHIEAKPVQTPGRRSFTCLVRGEPRSIVLPSSTDGANLNKTQRKKEK